MNIGNALLVKSGFNHVQNADNRRNASLDTLYTRLQWNISYKGIYHADTIACMKQYEIYCQAYTMKGQK